MADESAIIDENVDRLGGCGLIGCGVGAALFVLFGVLTLLTTLIWPILNQSDQENTVALTLSGPAGEVLAGSKKFSGNGTPNSTVELDLNGEMAGTTTVSGDGLWSLTSDVAEADSYTAIARSGDAVSNELSFTVVEPDAAINWEIPSLVLPAAAAITDPGKIAIGGVGTPGSNVDLFVNSTSAGRAAVGDDGNWSLDIGVSQYRNELEAVGLRPDDSEIGRTPMQLLLVPTAAGALTFDSDPQLADALDSGIVPFRWTGKGEPAATINLQLEQDPIGNTTVDADGNWAFDGQLNRDPGTYNMNAIMAADGTQLAQSELFPVTIPELVGAVPPSSNNDNEESTPEPTDVPAPATGLTIVSVNGGSTPNELVTINVESSEANAPVSLVVDSQSFALVNDSADDMGQLVYTGYFAAGDHTLVATSNDLTSEPFTFTVGDATQPGAAAGDGNGALRLLFTTGEATDDFLAGSPAVELIADASWSMTFPLDSDQEIDRLAADNPNSRIAIAKSALDQIVGELPEGAPVALRAFGNLRGNLECQTDLMVRLTPLNSDNLRGVIANIFPQFNANTAIAASLAQVGNDLAGTDREKLVVLLTDGKETCGGDPAAQIRALVDQGINVRVNVVGFAILDDALRNEFQSWAEIGGGEYYDAADADQLAEALVSALTVSYRILGEDGSAVATGVVGGRDVQLAPGVYQVELISADGISWQNVVVTPDGIVELVSQ